MRRLGAVPPAALPAVQPVPGKCRAGAGCAGRAAACAGAASIVFADAVTEKGTLTPLNAWTLKRWLPFLLLCAVLFACALELYLALGHGTAAYAGVAVYLSGFASYGAMGFSPSIWASGARSGFFFAFALAAAGALALRALPEKRMPWRVFGCTAAACALAQCLAPLGA